MQAKIKSLLAASLLWYALYSPCEAAETMYQISATDLATLTEDSQTLSEDNKQLHVNLESSMKDLEMLRQRLESVKSQLSMYQSLSQTALASSEETLKSLQETQQSLRKLEAKVKSKIKMGVEGTVTSADNAVNVDANLRISWQSSGYDIDIRANQSKQSLSATKWF